MISRIIRKIFLLSIVIISILSCQNNLNGRHPKNEYEQSLEIADSILINQYDGAKIAWSLSAKKMKKLTDEELLNFYDMKLDIFGKKSETTSTIYADSAKIDNSRDLITGKGNIKIYTPKGDLFGSSLKWDRNKGEIYSEDSVKVVKQGNVIHGKSFRSDEQFKHMVLQKATAAGEVSEQTQVW